MLSVPICAQIFICTYIYSLEATAVCLVTAQQFAELRGVQYELWKDSECPGPLSLQIPALLLAPFSPLPILPSKELLRDVFSCLR